MTHLELLKPLYGWHIAPPPTGKKLEELLERLNNRCVCPRNSSAPPCLACEASAALIAMTEPPAKWQRPKVKRGA